MIISLFFDFIVGFLLHRLRPWTLQFSQRESDLIRYALGLVTFSFIAAPNVGMQLSNCRHKMHDCQGWRYWFYLLENIFIGLIVTALSFGGGVVSGFLTDGE